MGSLYAREILTDFSYHLSLHKYVQLIDENIRATVVNGTHPGPLIKGYKDDRFEVRIPRCCPRLITLYITLNR